MSMKKANAVCIALKTMGILEIIEDFKKECPWDDVGVYTLKMLQFIHSVPGYEMCKAAREATGCKITVEDIGKSRRFLTNACDIRLI